MLSWSSIEAFISPIMFLKSKSSCSFFFFSMSVMSFLISLRFLMFFFFPQVFFLLHNLLLQCFFPGLFIWLSFMLAAFLRCLMRLGCSCLTKILVRSPWELGWVLTPDFRAWWFSWAVCPATLGVRIFRDFFWGWLSSWSALWSQGGRTQQGCQSFVNCHFISLF